MNKIGHWVVKDETAFTAATTVTADNVFTSDFTAYRLVIRFNSTAGGSIGMQLRVGGVAAATNYNRQILQGAGTTATIVRQTSQTSLILSGGTGGAFFSCIDTLIHGPQLAEGTTFNVFLNVSDGGYQFPLVQTNAGNHSTATAYDGFQIDISTGTMTGLYAVYALNKG
jgi:hypothetical protein